MHHVRGLVRVSSAQIIKEVEHSALHTTAVHHVKECFARVELVDAYGDRSVRTLIQTPKLLKYLEGLRIADAVQTIRDVQAMYPLFKPFSCISHSVPRKNEGAPPGDVPATERTDLLGSDNSLGKKLVKNNVPVLFIKGFLADTLKELDRRQIMLLSRIEGKLCASDAQLLQNRLKALRDVLPAKEKKECKELQVLKDIAVFRGLIQQLCTVHPKLALQVALAKTNGIPLCGSAGSIVRIVDLSSREAVETFFQAFRNGDNKLPASQSCATSLALRIKKECLMETSPPVSKPHHWIRSSELLRFCQEYNVDPGSVFPTDAYAIQRWSNGFFSPLDLPVVRRAAVMNVVKARRLLPRRVCLAALGAWCGSDIEREWIAFAMNGFVQSSECVSSKSGVKDSCDDQRRMEGAEKEGTNFVLSIPNYIAQKTTYGLILKDPRRNLVDNRLLHIYATLLSSGEISPSGSNELSSCFSSFLEECGDCHSVHERPEGFSFVFPLPTGNHGMQCSVYDMLQELAPRCSYWTTMLQKFSSVSSPFFTVFIAPFNELRVEVRLPPYHECVDAAKRLALDNRLPPMFPILWEDEDLLVVDKPAGLATSRHALSCTQNGDPNTLDLVSVLLAHRQRNSTTASSNSMTVLSSSPPLTRCGIVHRLDTSTSGCLVIAKSTEAANSLRHQMGTSAMFSQFGKVYHVLCVVVEREWQALPLSGVIKDHSDPKVTTSYRVLEYFVKSRVAFVECRLQQGKKHQIRRHLASMGMPLAGDVVHGGAACIESGIINRSALHACSISILHPLTGEKMTFSAPLPDDFRRALYLLRKMEKEENA